MFGGLGMVQAYYTSHTVYAFLLASTAIPAYLLARELNLGRLAAYLVAALSVAVPWMVLAGLVMTEVVAYPVFAWAVLAMVRCLAAPTARRDAAAMGAIALASFARTQFLVLAPILVIAMLLHDVVPAAARSRRTRVRADLHSALRQTLRVHLVLWALAGLVLVVVLGLVFTGSLESVLGAYITPVRGPLVPAGTLTAAFKELDGVTIGIGIVPLTLAVSWAAARAFRPSDASRHAFAVILLVSLPVFLWLVGSFDTRFLGGSTTDRYMFYFAPLLFTGAAAWVVDRCSSLLSLSIVSALVVWMVVMVGLHDSPTVDIIDPSFAIHHAFVGDSHGFTHAIGLPQIDPRILLALITSAFVLLVFAARRRFGTPYVLLGLTLPLLAYGVANTGYVMTKLYHDYSNIPASHPESLTWIDRLVPSSADVGLVIAPNGPFAEQEPVETWWTWWQPAFWNKTVQREFVFPGDDPFGQGFVTTLRQDLSHGRLLGLDGANYLIKLISDPRFALRGPIVELKGGTFVVYRVARGAPLLYGTNGVDQYSRLVPGSRPFLRVFGADAVASERVSLTLRTSAAPADCPCRIHFGRAYGDAVLTAASLVPQHAMPVTRIVTVPPHGYAQLNLEITGRDGRIVPWITLVSVRITNASRRP